MSKPKRQVCYPARYYNIFFSFFFFFPFPLFRPSVKEDSPKRPEETHAASVETPRVMEMDESRRKKLREVELKVAEYAQKLEAKGATDIALQCDIYRAKLMEVSWALSTQRGALWPRCCCELMPRENRPWEGGTVEYPVIPDKSWAWKLKQRGYRAERRSNIAGCFMLQKPG